MLLKELFKKKSKTLLFIGVFVMISLFVAYYFLPKEVDPLVVDDQVDDHNGVGGSVFQQYNDNQKQNVEIDPDSPAAEMQKIISSKDDSYWQGWSWEEKMVLGVVQEVDQANSTMNIIITLPSGREFSDQNRIAYVDCSLEQSALIKGSQPEQIVQESGVDILGTASFQDRLYAFCLDENCLNLGKQCVLTDMGQ